MGNPNETFILIFTLFLIFALSCECIINNETQTQSVF